MDCLAGTRPVDELVRSDSFHHQKLLLMVLFSFSVGLWIVSGQGCAGFCGPRYRWEEEEAEKRMSSYTDAGSDLDVIPWTWRECTRVRIQDAYDFCLTVRPSLRWSGKKQASVGAELAGQNFNSPQEPFDGLEQVLAAVGFPSVPPLAKRGALSEELFEGPKEGFPPLDLSDVIPKVAKRLSKDKQIAGPSAPITSLPYPFSAPGAHASSADRVPFPPSPGPTHPSQGTTSSESESGSGSTSSGSGSGSGSTDDDEDDDEDDENDPMSEEPSTGRASGSMSSLGHPVSPRYPFQFRRPGRGNSVSSGAASHVTPSSNARSMISQATQSTGNRESSDSHPPRSHETSGSDAVPLSPTSGIPMPPRHPQQGQGRGRGRQRAGTVPAVTAPGLAPTPVAFPVTVRSRTQTRSDRGSVVLPGVGSDEGHELLQDQASDTSHSEGSHSDEQDDVVGLLSSSAAPSPRTSLFGRGSNLSLHRSQGSRSGSKTRTDSHSSSSRSRTSSIQPSVRSRAQSLLHNIGAASHSSLELVQTAIRSRANSSMARLEEDSMYSSGSHSRSGSGSAPSVNENNTFGVPVRRPWALPPFGAQDAVEEEPTSLPPTPLQDQSFHESHSTMTFGSPLMTTVMPASRSSSVVEPSLLMVTAPSSPVDVPQRNDFKQDWVDASVSSGSPAGISTAPQSFVTAPATIAGTSESSGGRTVASWGDFSHLVDRTDGTAWRPSPA